MSYIHGLCGDEKEARRRKKKKEKKDRRRQSAEHSSYNPTSYLVKQQVFKSITVKPKLQRLVAPLAYKDHLVAHICTVERIDGEEYKSGEGGRGI